MPSTELYNEGWLLRLTLDWFKQNGQSAHQLKFFSEAKWYSEARLRSPFLPEYRGDNRAESHTHADGIIGHFDIGLNNKAEATLSKEAKQFIVIEAKLGSNLSPGVKNAPGYDQAARSAACIANLGTQYGFLPDLTIRMVPHFDGKRDTHVAHSTVMNARQECRAYHYRHDGVSPCATSSPCGTGAFDLFFQRPEIEREVRSNVAMGY